MSEENPDIAELDIYPEQDLMAVSRVDTAARDHRGRSTDHATGTPHTLPCRMGQVSTNVGDPADYPAGDVTTSAAAQPGQAPDSGVQAIMHARLKTMAEPRSSDSPELARLRRLMRDPQVAADLTANVDQWPAPTDEQREVLAALLNRPRPGR